MDPIVDGQVKTTGMDIAGGPSHADGRRRQRRPRTSEQRARRREKERGPWDCPLCDHQPYASISGLRGHVALFHQQYCTWSGNTRPFIDHDEERCLVATIREGRRHRGGYNRRAPGAPQPDMAFEGPLDNIGVGRCRLMTPYAPSLDAVGTDVVDINPPEQHAQLPGVAQALQQEVFTAGRAVAMEAVPPATTADLSQDLAAWVDELIAATDLGLTPPAALPKDHVPGLPQGVTLEDLLHLLHANRGSVVADWADRLVTICRHPPTDTQLELMNAVIRGMDLAERRGIATAIAQHTATSPMLE